MLCDVTRSDVVWRDKNVMLLNVIIYNVTWCDMMWCHVLLCDVMCHNVVFMWCDVSWCYAMLCAMTCYEVVMSYVTWCIMIRCYVTRCSLDHITQDHVMCYVMLSNAMWCDVMDGHALTAGTISYRICRWEWPEVVSGNEIDMSWMDGVHGEKERVEMNGRDLITLRSLSTNDRQSLTTDDHISSIMPNKSLLLKRTYVCVRVCMCVYLCL